MITFEYALVAGALALYLYDCCMLLYANAVLCIGSHGRWRMVVGGEASLFGKRICIAAPFQPWELIFRGAWSERPVAGAPPREWPAGRFVKALMPVRVIATFLLALLLAMPVIVVAGEYVAELLLLAFAIYYALVLVALAWIALRREELALRWRQVGLLSFDALACAPFAVNLVRKISLLQPLEGDAILFTRMHLDGESRRAALLLLASRVDEFLRAAAPGSDQALQLQALHARITEEPA